MTFALTVDGKVFEKHLSGVIADFKKVDAAVVPVIKGNGYGFGRRELAKQSTKLGAKRIAVGTVYELDQALTDFADEIVVLEPFNPADVATVSVWESVTKNNAHRVFAVLAGNYFAQAAQAGIKLVLLEGNTSTHRFGVNAGDMLLLLNAEHHNITISGLQLHIPIAEPTNVRFKSSKLGRKTSSRISEIAAWLETLAPVVNAMGWPLSISLSHVTTKDVEQISNIAKELGHNISIDVRLGTSLWLGNQKALKATGTVLEIHELTGEHEHVGYRQVDAHGNARLLIVSGGTAHGVALAAPASRETLRGKTIAVAQGISEAIGKVRSPFKWQGKNLPFAEPPHMHVSLLWTDDRNVKVGDQLECTVRNTTASFDVVNGL